MEKATWERRNLVESCFRNGRWQQAKEELTRKYRALVKKKTSRRLRSDLFRRTSQPQGQSRWTRQP